jgi:ABC-type nitrate/sulfonate/bicarbonate transport system substrate-binding protein
VIKAQRDAVLRVLRGYHEGVQETRNDRNSAVKILAKYVTSTIRRSYPKFTATMAWNC